MGLKKPPELCNVCRLTYDAFRTGLNFADVTTLMKVGGSDSNDWVYRRRNGVLGKWHEIKMDMWAEHRFWCDEEASRERAPLR